MPRFRYAVSVMPKPGILDPQGRAVEGSLRHLDAEAVTAVRIGRRIELTAAGSDEAQAREIVERLASELFANPLVETWQIDRVASSEHLT